MNSVSDDYTAYTEDEDLQVKGVNTIVDYLQYSVNEELKEDQNYASLLSSSNKVGKKNLSTALNVICKHTKEQFILIMDEWDLIYRDFRNDTQLQISFNNFLRGLLKGKSVRAVLPLPISPAYFPSRNTNLSRP